MKAVWIEKYPMFKNIYSIKFIDGLVKACDISTSDHPERDAILFQFITGLAAMVVFIQSTDKIIWDRINALLKPGLNAIISHLSSDPFQKYLLHSTVSGDRVLEYVSPAGSSGVKKIEKIPLTPNELLIYIKRSNSFPIIPDHIDEIQDDFRRFMDSKYLGDKKQIKITNMDKAIITYFRYLRDDKKAAVRQAFREEDWSGSDDDVYNKLVEIAGLVLRKNKNENDKKKLKEYFSRTLKFLTPKEQENVHKEFLE